MTQLQQATKGIATSEILTAAKEEHIEADILMQLIKEGKVVIPHNQNRKAIPTAIGSKMTTKINANIGTSELCCEPDTEIAKLHCVKNIKLIALWTFPQVAI
jgi:phosphomethylpyrimidine synthase